MKLFVFQFNFYLNLFSNVQLANANIGLENRLAMNRQQTIIWRNGSLFYLCPIELNYNQRCIGILAMDK